MMTKPITYKLDVNKIKTLKDVRNIFECMNLVSNATETHENYEILKEYFTIPYVAEKIVLNWEDDRKMTEQQPDIPYVDISTENTISFHSPKHSNWKCYLFGNRPGGMGMMYIPQEGQVPNRFVRFMMRICFDCLWMEEK